MRTNPTLHFGFWYDFRNPPAWKEMGIFSVVDVDTCIQMIRDCAAQAPLTHFYSWTLPPGLLASWIRPHLELFARKVIPAFRS